MATSQWMDLFPSYVSTTVQLPANKNGMSDDEHQHEKAAID